MRPIASLVVLLLLLLLAFGASVPAAAQDGTPITQSEGRQAAGDEVLYLDAEGEERGLITVAEIADPFAEFDPASPPEAGSRYVLLTVAFENTGGQPLEADPNDLLLRGVNGSLWTPTTVPRPDDVAIPELQNQQMAPGNRVSGVVGFVVPEEVELDQVFYQPESGRLILLADILPGPGPALGSEVFYVDPEGGRGLVVATEIFDPFEEFEPSQPPEAGSRYVLLNVAFENIGEQPFQADPYDLLLRDADGFLWAPTTVPRPADVAVPDLESQTMAPGNRVSGVVGFVVPEDAELAGVHYQPESGVLILLADLLAGAGAAATPAAGDAVTTPAAATAAGCEGVEAWLADTGERLDRMAEISREVAALEDVAGLEELATEFAELAEAQAAGPIPPPAEEINAAIVDVLTAFADALDRIATAADPDKDLALEISAGMNAFNNAAATLEGIGEQVVDLATDCDIDL